MSRSSGPVTKIPGCHEVQERQETLRVGWQLGLGSSC
jgi:hypothetical protein